MSNATINTAINVTTNAALFDFLPENELIRAWNDISPLLIFAAVGMIAYSIYVSKVEGIKGIKNKPIQKKFLDLMVITKLGFYHGFLIFAIINLSSIILIFVCIVTRCFRCINLSFSFPFITIFVGVWFILMLAILDLLG